MDQNQEKETLLEEDTLNQDNQEKESLIQEKQDEEQEIELAVEQQNPVYSEIPLQTVELIDYWNLIYQGKFEIALLSDIDYSINSPNGFGLVHYLATFNNLEGFKLLANRNANLDTPSRQNQTALQIACSYGYIEICQLLIYQGCSLTQLDSYGCSALFYALKQKRYGLALYLMTLTELNGLTDQSGCSVVHWLSFNDDIFMLRFFNLLEYSYNLFDQQGRTPLGTACFNYSYNSINFFLEEQPIMFSYPYEQSSKSIQIKIQRMKALRHFKAQFQNNKIITRILDNKQHLLVAAVLFIIFINLIAFLISDCFQDYNDTFFGLLLCFAYIILLFYQAGYFIFFIRKTTDKQSEGQIIFKRPSKKQNEEQELIQNKPEQNQENQQQYQNFNTNDDFQIPISQPIQNKQDVEEDKVRIEREIPRSSYDYGKTPRYLEGIKIKDFLQINYRPVEEFIDRLKIKPNYYFKFAQQIGQHKEEIEQLIQIDDPLWYNSFTIIHFLYFFFTTNRFRAIHAIDWNRICPTCLQYKMPRTYHCKACKECVKDYHFHSYLFGKCINSTNHLFYFIFILGSTIVVNLYLLFILTYYYDRSRSIFLLPVEIVNFLYQSSLFEVFIYILNNIIAYYLNIQFLIEAALITFNMTYNEIFNSQRYRYLFEAYKISTGQVYLKWKTRFPKGLINNYLFYLVNSFKNMRIK